ncbi:hypothetical protein F5X98DRAFT_331056 [Xylaria grammica]|nr:hypothetical protein F5X98DRAFT_331056 [Xylaria grammica]
MTIPLCLFYRSLCPVMAGFILQRCQHRIDYTAARECQPNPATSVLARYNKDCLLGESWEAEYLVAGACQLSTPREPLDV